jgi:hypothetical protein
MLMLGEGVNIGIIPEGRHLESLLLLVLNAVGSTGSTANMKK